MLDLRLHTRTHLARISEVIDNGARLYRAIEEREPKDYCEARQTDFTKTAKGMNSGDPPMELKDLKWKLGHYVHNGTMWAREQVEHYPLVRNLCIEVNISAYKSMGFVEPHTTCPRMVCGLANTGSCVNIIRPSNYVDDGIIGELPSGWQECTSRSTGQTYFLNQFTRQSQWG